MLNAKTLWYLTRGTGLVSMVLLTASLVLGIVQVQRWARPGWPRFLTTGLHRNISLLSTAFIAVHIATAVADSFAPLGLRDIVVPFVSHYRPIWLGLGTLAFDLFLAVIVTSLLRSRLGYRTWKAVHWLSYALWPVALVHSLGTGSDLHTLWVQALLGICLLAVLAAIWWRLSTGAPETAARRLLGGAASLAALGILMAWAVVGPLGPSWASRSGTPPALLGTQASAGTPAGTGTPPAGTASSLVPPFSATLSGTVSIADSGGTRTETIDAALHGRASANLQVVLSGAPAEGGGLEITTSAVMLGSPSAPNEYQGRVFSIGPGHFVAVVTDARGDQMTLTATLQIDRAAGTLSGALFAQAGTGTG